MYGEPVTGRRLWYEMSHPNAARRVAIAPPMRPRPMMPTRLPLTWRVSG